MNPTLLIAKLNEIFPALPQLFEKYLNRIAVQGVTLDKLVWGCPVGDDISIKIFFCGITDEEATRMLFDCIGIIGSYSSSSSSSTSSLRCSSFAIEELLSTKKVVKVTKDNSAYIFSRLILPNITYLCRTGVSRVYDGFSIFKLSNISEEITTCDAPIRKRIQPSEFPKFAHKGLELSYETVCKMLHKVLFSHAQSMDIAARAMKLLQQPLEQRSASEEVLIFGEYASTYRTMNEKQLSDTIFELEWKQKCQLLGELGKREILHNELWIPANKMF